MNTNLQSWVDVVKNSFNQIGVETITFLPTLLVAILILILGLVLAKLVSKLIRRILYRVLKFNWFASRINTIKLFTNNTNDSNQNLIIIVSKFTYWVIVLFFLVVTSDLLGWEIVSKEVGILFRYIPKLLSGIVIFIIGMYIARFIKHGIANVMESFAMSGGKIISNAAFYIVMIFVTITALNQVDINTTIINQNITIIIGAIFVSFAIAFGFASRNILESFISGSYSRNNLEIGMTIKIDGKVGVIKKIDNVSITIVNDEMEHVFPLKRLAETNYDIINKK
ncbi:MAG: hypothetical protein CSA39_01600 [Flavobacteriales bacterium]|nr:MAG: hypothetical protein CSA39_01600 [Flavobacteriales bacterium]